MIIHKYLKNGKKYTLGLQLNKLQQIKTGTD